MAQNFISKVLELHHHLIEIGSSLYYFIETQCVRLSSQQQLCQQKVNCHANDSNSSDN